MKKIIYIVLIILIFVSCENNHEKRELKKIYGENNEQTLFNRDLKSLNRKY